MLERRGEVSERLLCNSEFLHEWEGGMVGDGVKVVVELILVKRVELRTDE